jgi:glucokinase
MRAFFMRQFLCADIGATNARFACVQSRRDGLTITARQTFSSPTFTSVADLVATARNALPADYSAIALALPGPVVANCCKVTLLPWEVCSADIQRASGIHTCLLNDLEAQGWGIDRLAPQECIALTPDLTGREGNRAIIAPGSDLGEAILYWDGNAHRPFPTEGGHCDFAPTDPVEWRLTELLREQYGHARWGDLLSGRGIVSLYRLLSADSDCCKSGEDISQLARDGDARAQEAIERFLHLLGRESANLALKAMAVGGLYIAGGIVPSLPREQVKRTVCRAFAEKPSMAQLLAQIPLRLIDSANLGILGAATYLQTLTAAKPHETA